MFCPECGSANSDRARFCTNCGMTLTKKESTAPGKPTKQKAFWELKSFWRLVGTISASVVLVVFLGIYIWSSGKSSVHLNDNPPEYVDYVNASEAGPNGVIVYFVLCDKSGEMTTSDGKVTLSIFQQNDDFLSTTPGLELYSRSFELSKLDFQKTTLGIGDFTREFILYDFGRIEYASSNSTYPTYPVCVKVVFQTTDGRTLESDLNRAVRF